MNEILTKVLESTVTLVIGFGTIWLKDHLEKKNKKGKDLAEDYERKQKIQHCMVIKVTVLYH